MFAFEVTFSDMIAISTECWVLLGLILKVNYTGPISFDYKFNNFKLHFALLLLNSCFSVMLRGIEDRPRACENAAKKIRRNDASVFTCFELNNTGNLVPRIQFSRGKDRPQSRENVYRGFLRLLDQTKGWIEKI